MYFFSAQFLVFFPFLIDWFVFSSSVPQCCSECCILGCEVKGVGPGEVSWGSKGWERGFITLHVVMHLKLQIFCMKGVIEVKYELN